MTTEPVPTAVVIAIDPASRRDDTAIATVAQYADGTVRALDVVTSKRLQFKHQVRAVGGRLADVRKLWPAVPVLIIVDATGGSSALPETIGDKLPGWDKSGRTKFVGLYWSHGTPGKRPQRVKDAPQWAWSVGRDALLGWLIYDITTRQLDLTGLPEAARQLVATQMGTWRPDAHGKVDHHGRDSHDDALCALAMGACGLDMVARSAVTVLTVSHDISPARLKRSRGKHAGDTFADTSPVGGKVLDRLPGDAPRIARTGAEMEARRKANATRYALRSIGSPGLQEPRKGA